MSSHDRAMLGQFNENRPYWSQRYNSMGGKKTVGHFSWTKEQYDAEQKKFTDVAEPILKQLKPKTILDFGCGIGRWSPMLIRNCKKYFAADLMRQALDQCKSSLTPEELEKSKFEPIINGTMPFKAQSFDLIWTCVVLQHVVDEDLLSVYLREFRQILNKDGRIFICENVTEAPNKNYMTFRSPQQYDRSFWSRGFEPVKRDTFYFGKEPHLIHVYKIKEK